MNVFNKMINFVDFDKLETTLFNTKLRWTVSNEDINEMGKVNRGDLQVAVNYCKIQILSQLDKIRDLVGKEEFEEQNNILLNMCIQFKTQKYVSADFCIEVMLERSKLEKLNKEIKFPIAPKFQIQLFSPETSPTSPLSPLPFLLSDIPGFGS